MPGWLTEVLKLLGFTTPFVYAAATYGAFHWLDKKASGQAKRAVSDWLQSKPADSDSLGNAVIEMFSRIYTPRLFSFRAFARSAIITILISCVFLYETGDVPYVITRARAAYPVFIASILANICSDYVSLFVVKSTLVYGKRTAVVALIRGVTAGVSVVAGFAVIQNVVIAVIDIERMGLGSRSFFEQLSADIEVTFVDSFWFALFLASLVVHLWLPLFLLAAWVLRGLKYLKLAVGWMQWFLKQGQHHPFQAVGYVASVIVFVCGVAIQYAWR